MAEHTVPTPESPASARSVNTPDQGAGGGAGSGGAGRTGRTERTQQPGKRRAKRMGLYLFIVVGLFAFVLGLIVSCQRYVMFPRHLVDVPSEPQPPDDAELWHIDTSAGEVEGWFLPGDGVSAQNPGPAVIFAHGNGEAIDDWPEMLADYRAMGISVLLPEFRGYGRSAGRPSEAAIVDDFASFYDRLAQRADVDAQRIVFHGRSIGNGVMAGLSRRRESAAWISQSSFTSAAALAWEQFWLPRVLVRDPFDVLRAVEAYDGPMLILHGAQDNIIPPHHAERLHDAATQSELVLYENMGHNEPPPMDRYWRDIGAFLFEAEILQSAGRSPESDSESDPADVPRD